MKSRQGLSFLSILLMGTFIFLGAYKAANASEATASSKQHSAVQKEAKILATVMVVNKNEINLAQEALSKRPSSEVKQYAKMLKKQHTQNLKASMSLAHKLGITQTELDKALSKEAPLQKTGAEALQSLSSLNGKDFEKAYVDAMVKGHTKVLNMMDKDLIKNASNPSLNKFLVDTRAHVLAHLEQGKKIQKGF